jgi:hypothetical protein
MTDVEDAQQLYEGFREEPAERARPIKIKLPKAVAIMGHVEFVGYVTTHRGKTHLYVHQFAEGSRPLFTASKKAIVFVGGRYRVTSRGIVDVNQKGQEVKGRDRYKITVK